MILFSCDSIIYEFIGYDIITLSALSKKKKLFYNYKIALTKLRKLEKIVYKKMIIRKI